MPKLLVSGLAIGRMAGWHAPEPQGDATPLVVACQQTLQTWMGRRRQRKTLAGLAAEMNNHLLQDIGVSQDAAFREASKPFWRR
jgi:uncharacterized protein YjiS (DUF1127 family)